MTKLKKKLPFISLFLLFLLYYLFRLYQIPKFFIPQKEVVKIVGRVSQQPYLKGSYQIIKVGPVLIKTERFPGYFYGDKLIITGKFEKRVINPFTLQYFAFFPTIQKIKEEENFFDKKNFLKFLFKIRGQMEENLNQFLPEPQAGLLLGIIFGVKSQISNDFLQNLRKTGTLHLVVTSGQHIAMVSAFLMNVLLLFFKRRKALLISLFGLLVYILITGAKPPVVRAGLMTFMVFIVQLLGREGNQGKFFLLTVVVMLLMSPLILFDISFQLSFAATAGIIWLYPRLKGKTKKTYLPFLKEAFLITISAQLATLPILLVNFGQFSWLSPLVNVFVLPTVPFIIALGLSLAILSLFSKLIGQLLAWFIWPFLTWFVKVVTWFGNLSFGQWEIGKISWFWVVGYYLLLFLLIKFIEKRRFNERVRNS